MPGQPSSDPLDGAVEELLAEIETAIRQRASAIRDETGRDLPLRELERRLTAEFLGDIPQLADDGTDAERLRSLLRLEALAQLQSVELLVDHTVTTTSRRLDDAERSLLRSIS
jgi:hypothetical protein